MWPRPSICVATLSLMNRALLVYVVFSEFSFSLITASWSPWLSIPGGVRKEMISPGLCPANLKLRLS